MEELPSLCHSTSQLAAGIFIHDCRRSTLSSPGGWRCALNLIRSVSKLNAWVLYGLHVMSPTSDQVCTDHPRPGRLLSDDSELSDMSAFDTHSSLVIPFNSLADALVARLRLEEGLGNSSIKLFLDLIHDPSVDMRKLSFTNASQIDNAVAAYKFEQQYLRAFSCEATCAGSSQTVKGTEIPYPILDGILNAIANDDALVDEPAVYQIPLLDGSEFYRSDCLRNMALVHRSWTMAAQQRLARRIIVRSPSSVLRLLRSPIPCTHTQELIISIGDVFNRGFQASRDRPNEHLMQYLRPGDIEEDLVSLLKRMTSLQSLTVKESGLREDRILLAVSTLKTIETLRWHCAHGQPSCGFNHLVEALGNLPKIRDLEVSGWSFHSNSEAPVTEPPLRASLENLKLCISPVSVPHSLNFTLSGTYRLPCAGRFSDGALRVARSVTFSDKTVLSYTRRDSNRDT